MKKILLIIGLLFITISAVAQTNIINISNSRVVINNYIVATNTVQQVQSSTNSFKKVVIPQEIMERLRWEGMLEERRKVMFRSYLRKYSR